VYSYSWFSSPKSRDRLKRLMIAKQQGSDSHRSVFLYKSFMTEKRNEDKCMKNFICTICPKSRDRLTRLMIAKQRSSDSHRSVFRYKSFMTKKRNEDKCMKNFICTIYPTGLHISRDFTTAYYEKLFN
jgi:hypothetical protein